MALFYIGFLSSAVLGVGFLPLGLLGIMMLSDLFPIPGQLKKQEARVRNDLLVRLVSS
jgi:mannose/fructose/N-acetylgalactosamine-specific phosphotransferase system component IIC